MHALPAAFSVPQIRRYQHWLEEHRGLTFASYDDLWRWSITDLDAFWQSVWDYFELQSPTPHTAVLAQRSMPGAQWFPGARVNYAQQVFRHVDPADAAGMPALLCHDEKSLGVRPPERLSWGELRQRAASLARALQDMGVLPGDRIAAYLPNGAQAMVGFLACASIGAVWSICAPDMGTNAVLDRFRQIEPRILIACDGITYGGRDHPRLEVVARLRAALPSVTHLLVHDNKHRPLPAADGLPPPRHRQGTTGHPATQRANALCKKQLSAARALQTAANGPPAHFCVV